VTFVLLITTTVSLLGFPTVEVVFEVVMAVELVEFVLLVLLPVTVMPETV